MRSWIFMVFILLANVTFGQSVNDAYSLGVQGIQKVDEGNYDEGIALLKKARNLEPQDYDYAFEIGKAYMLKQDFQKAEKHLFPLQYHVNAQADLYLLLSTCYGYLEQMKKAPDPQRKKELDALRYGIQKLPEAGILYLELAKRNLELERSVEALATLENGIRNAPVFAENYYWAAKLMKASSGHFWAWIYAEACFNMTDDVELQRSSARIIDLSLKAIAASAWKPEPNKMETDLRFLLDSKCTMPKNSGIEELGLFRNCLLTEWNVSSYSFSQIFERLKKLNEKDWLDTATWQVKCKKPTEPLF